MIWKTSRDSTLLPAKDGLLAVRVDGDPDKAPLLLCQRFRGTMDDWDPEFVARLSTARRERQRDSFGHRYPVQHYDFVGARADPAPSLCAPRNYVKFCRPRRSVAPDFPGFRATRHPLPVPGCVLCIGAESRRSRDHRTPLERTVSPRGIDTRLGIPQ
jgi:hypothetical protein